MSERGKLSQRGQQVASSPPVAQYIREHFERSTDPWHPKDNPAGYVSMCMAENKLMWDWLEPRLRQPRRVAAKNVAYDAMTGSIELRAAISAFTLRTFLGRAFDTDCLAILNGAGSALDYLVHLTCDDGDGVLLPTPSYSGFINDIEGRAGATVVPVHCSPDDQFRLTVEGLEEAIEKSAVPVKAFVYTNPNNPLGCVYRAEEVESIVSWGVERGLHVIVDEIYALSNFGPSRFTSVAEIFPTLGAQIHIVWSFSKDFAMSGLRAGLLVSENKEVMQAVEGYAYWAATSGDTQALLMDLLSDEEWIDQFLVESRRRLATAYERATATLRRYDIPYFPAEAGFFFLCDLREFMDSQTWLAENSLWWRILDEASVNLTPGAACRNGYPGFFRVVFSAEPTAAIVAGLERVGQLLRST